MRMKRWHFAVDVGGTFTDCVGYGPDGSVHTLKRLSSGITPGLVDVVVGSGSFVDPERSGDPENFWEGSRIVLIDPGSGNRVEGQVTASQRSTGRLSVDLQYGGPPISAGMRYEVHCSEEAPLLAVRHVLGLGSRSPLPPISLRLGTTRGTNALLTRSGPRTALLTTRGFADLLTIGNQSRPRLFDLTIRKSPYLFTDVVEIDERITADGTVLRPIVPEDVRQVLRRLVDDGVESIAIFFLHSWTDPTHELRAEEIVREFNFTNVTRSSMLSQVIGAIPRGNSAVLDAWLNPVLREYLYGIASKLHPDSTMHVMTSGGGLLGVESFSGRDSILSGPAGGVIGYARVAAEEEFPAAIGFDMGGTSTDVSRFAGSLEREYETERAGVPIYSPTLAIETVAAGGGSICGFDGVRLTVGPASAGADPGPACYGRGGPLTITDMNLLLGRILPERFPFPLDRPRVDRLVAERIDAIARSPMGREYSPHELAEGYLRIADERMVRAVRTISVARGYDPADHVLIPFGGAGGQHACAIARELGIRRIALHPHAGILSAWGIGRADVRQVREESVMALLDEIAGDGLDIAFSLLEQTTRDAVRAEGILRNRIESPHRSLELRYTGQHSTIEIGEPDDGDWQSTFERRHRALFGYVHEGRPIEVVTARVEIVGRVDMPDADTASETSRIFSPITTVRSVFGGEEIETPVRQRQDLDPETPVHGPAIICDPFSTLVVEPDFRATVNRRGVVMLERIPPDISAQEKPDNRAPDTSRPDPILLEIFNNLFASIAEQMGEVLRKTSMSTNVRERLDYSCALFSPTGELVVNAPHIPVHLGAMGETVRRIIAENPDLGPGDVFITNDPFRGGSHLPDITVVTPVHDAGGRILFFTASRAHHAEIGGITPGSMPPFSTNLAEEGIVISGIRLVERGESREEEIADLLRSGPWPSRDIDSNLADIRAQVAANRRGEELLRELMERHTPEQVTRYMDHVREAAAAKVRIVLGSMPDGTHHFVDHLDDGTPIAVSATVSGDRVRIDFTGSGPVRSSNLNANRAIVTAAVLYVVRCMVGEDIPLNDGLLDRVEIIVPEGILDPTPGETPETSPAVVGGNVETSQRVVDVLLGAFGLAAASQGTMNNLTFGDERFGYYETICGGSGATPEGAGADAVHTHMTNTRLTDVEILEHRYPVRIGRFAVRRGSGGAGEHRGGDGVEREIEFLRPLHVSILSQRRGDYAPWGLDGGGEGARGENLLERSDGSSGSIGGSGEFDAAPGDLLIIRTPGGGGYGVS